MEVMFMYEVYTVRSGDTLSSISSHYGMNENELRRINGFSPIDEVVDSSLIVVPVRGKRNYQYVDTACKGSSYRYHRTVGSRLCRRLSGFVRER